MGLQFGMAPTLDKLGSSFLSVFHPCPWLKANAQAAGDHLDGDYGDSR